MYGLRHSLTCLTRLGRRRPDAESRLEGAMAGRLEVTAPTAVEVAIETGDPIGRVLAGLLAADPPAGVIESLSDRFDELGLEGVMPLRELILVTTRVELERWLAQDDGSRRHLEEGARLHYNLAIALSDLGRRDDALESAREALLRFRDLEARTPADYRTDVARCLSLLASELDAREPGTEALAAMEEAIALLRRSQPWDPGQALLLSELLNNLGGALYSLGRFPESLAAIEEALETLQECTDLSSVDRESQMADKLSNLAVALQACGRPGEAHAANRQSVEKYRHLAAERPDVFRPDLARGLENESEILRSLERHDEAATAADEAHRIHEELAEERPEAFGPGANYRE